MHNLEIANFPGTPVFSSTLELTLPKFQLAT